MTTDKTPPLARTPKPGPPPQPKPAVTEDDIEEAVHEEGGSHVPGWYVTFADMVTLLLCMFVLLFAMSTVEKVKYEKLRQSLRSAIGGIETISGISIGEGLGVLVDKAVDESTVHGVDQVGAMVNKEMDDIVMELEKFTYKSKMTEQVQVDRDDRGVIVTISDMTLFTPGDSRITPQGGVTMKKIFDLLRMFDHEIRIEGHTDNTPIRTERFPSNWELSASRAIDVARMLIQFGFPPEKLSIQGYAEFHPKVANDTEQHRAQNRRIEIVFQRENMRRKMLSLIRQGPPQ